MTVVKRLLVLSSIALAVFFSIRFGWDYADAYSVTKGDPVETTFQIITWAGPWLLLAVTTLLAPSFATWILSGAAAISAAVWVWWAYQPDIGFINVTDHGPVLVLLYCIVASCIALLGLHSPLFAGALLTGVTGIPLLIDALGIVPDEHFSLVYTEGIGPFLIAGVVLMIAAALPTPAPVTTVTDSRFAPASGSTIPTRRW